VRAGTGVAALARDEDTDISAPITRRRSAVPWIAGVGAGLVIGAVAVVTTLLLTGVL
jgi:hypothetical protein